MTPDEARKRVYLALADTAQGMGLKEFIPPSEFEQLTTAERRLVLDSFNAVIGVLRELAEA